MAIVDHSHFPWMVCLAGLCLAGCQQAEPAYLGESTSAPTASAADGASGAAVNSGTPPAAGSTKTATDSGEPASAAASQTASDGGKAGSVAASDAGTPPPTASGGTANSAGVAGASGSASAAPETPDAAVAAGACTVRPGTAAKPGFAGDWTPGTYPENFTSASAGNYLKLSGLANQGNMDREYAVHVPPGYDKAAPLPALFCLHAFSMNALSFCEEMAGWPAKADKEKFILIMPNGYQNSWNIGEDCGAGLLPVHTEGIDDVGFIRALLDEVGKHVNIDLGRVYATGFSNGSSLAWRLACDASDIIAAVVPVAAGSCLASCKPSSKVSVLDVYGGADSFNPTVDIASTMAAVQAISGCSVSTMPAAFPMSTGANQCLSSTGCSSGECSAIEVTQCVVQNGSHCWYGDISKADCGAGAADGEFNMTNLAWEFLKRFSR